MNRLGCWLTAAGGAVGDGNTGVPKGSFPFYKRAQKNPSIPGFLLMAAIFDAFLRDVWFSELRVLFIHTDVKAMHRVHGQMKSKCWRSCVSFQGGKMKENYQ